VSLVFMGVMFVLIIALLVAVLAIKKKVNNLHEIVDEKIAQIRAISDKANIALKTVRHFVKH
jgi:uncharacterized membrane protein